MHFFEEIDKLKKDLPKYKNVSDGVSNIQLNFYQKIAVVVYVICLLIGVLFGNVFPACGSSSEFYSGVCLTTEFNFSLMIFIWFGSFLLCLLFYSIGTIIGLLSSINNKLSQK